jgi:preprotein translocase subunit SecY
MFFKKTIFTASYVLLFKLMKFIEAIFASVAAQKYLAHGTLTVWPGFNVLLGTNLTTPSLISINHVHPVCSPVL